MNQVTQSRDVHELVVPETLYTILQKLMNVSRVPVKTVVTVQSYWLPTRVTASRATTERIARLVSICVGWKSARNVC